MNTMLIIGQASVLTGDGWLNVEAMLSHLFKWLPIWAIFSFAAVRCFCEQDRLQSLSVQEREDLRFFMHYLFAKTELGYTLFGDKPLSLCFLPRRTPVFSLRQKKIVLCEDSVPYFKGLTAWRKLGMRRGSYSLIIHEESQSLMTGVVFCINRNRSLEVLKTHVGVLKRAYGKSMTPELFLERLETQKLSLDDLFQNHVLLGTLLGYGRRNAERFQRRWDLENEEKPPFMRDRRKPRGGFPSIQEELIDLQHRLTATAAKQGLVLLVAPVTFAGDLSDSETARLTKKYNAVHQKLTDLFKKETWLHTILEKVGSVES